MATDRPRLYRPGLDHRRRPATADRDGASRLDGSEYSVALYVLLSCVISIAATIPLPDYTNRDISEEPVYGLAESAVSAQAASGG